MNERFSKLFEPAARRRLVLRRGKEKLAANRHPWIFAGAIHSESGPAEAAIADLYDPSGEKIASGFHSAASQIRMRALVFGDEVLDAGTIASRIAMSVGRRGALLDGQTDAVRLVNAEGDDLSGIVVDRYRDVAVVEITNSGADQLRPLIADAVKNAAGIRTIWFKNDLPARALEGLSQTSVQEGEGDVATEILENGLHFHVDPREGQKTGFFLDQRENRRMVRDLAPGRRTLNLFAYTGGFGVYAASGGATSVTDVDVSSQAIELATRNHALNGSRHEGVVADAFQYVRRRHEAFDLIVCDPPAFARNRSDVERAARGYKDVNLHAMRLAAPGARLLTFSCSGHMSLDLFQKVIFAAAVDAGRRVSFLRRLGAGPDHPVSLYCPEGEYLKGFLLEIH
jgi:23S rRNA (cytosine1962-C5)-methyltransferase